MENSDRKLIWVVFYGLSALGKTHFLNEFAEECKHRGIHCQIVSSDDCSKKIIDGIKQKNPTISDDAAFEQSRKPAIKLFETTIEKSISSMKKGNNIIVLDKVMNGGKFLQTLNKTFNPGCSTKLVAIIPKSEEPFQYSNYSTVPFSLPLIINVCHRIVKRSDHQTVTGSDSKKLFLALSFVKLYNNMKHLSEKKEEGGIDEFVELSFHKEDPQSASNLPGNLVNLFKSTIKSIKPFQGSDEVCTELADYMKTAVYNEDVAGVIGFGDVAQQKQQLDHVLSLFDSF